VARSSSFRACQTPSGSRALRSPGRPTSRSSASEANLDPFGSDLDRCSRAEPFDQVLQRGNRRLVLAALEPGDNGLFPPEQPRELDLGQLQRASTLLFRGSTTGW
jgi:hypothetical protein